MQEERLRIYMKKHLKKPEPAVIQYSASNEKTPVILRKVKNNEKKSQILKKTQIFFVSGIHIYRCKSNVTYAKTCATAAAAAL